MLSKTLILISINSIIIMTENIYEKYKLKNLIFFSGLLKPLFMVDRI